MFITKRDWILIVLQKKPLDRIHIMKALFLIGHRSKKKIADYFIFEPYLYGPCSLEVYSELRGLLASGLIVQPAHALETWGNYHLTEEGAAKAQEAFSKADSETAAFINSILDEIANLSFFDLLKKVYEEAPEFAVNSVIRGVIKR